MGVGVGRLGRVIVGKSYEGREEEGGKRTSRVESSSPPLSSFIASLGWPTTLEPSTLR